MKNFVIIFSAVLLLWSCGGDGDKTADTSKSEDTKTEETKSEASVDGIGEYTNIVLNDPLDQTMVDAGNAI